MMEHEKQNTPMNMIDEYDCRRYEFLKFKAKGILQSGSCIG